MLGYYQHGNESDMVLVRINGNSTEIFLDRANEVSRPYRVVVAVVVIATQLVNYDQ